MNTLLENIAEKEKLGITICQSNANELTVCRVDSFFAFDFLVSQFKKEHYPYDCTWNRYYRGVSNAEYDLICSLCVNNLQWKESTIINRLYSQAPDRFSHCKSDFEMVALMQHYGLPTRLLDFTKNPLVALWFACQINGEADTDGAVYLALSNQFAQKNYIDLVFKIALAGEFDHVFGVSNILDAKELSDYLCFKALLYQGMLFIEAPVIDLRERNQQAVFLVGTNDVIISERNDCKSSQIISQDNLPDVLVELEKEETNKRISLGKISCYRKDEDSEHIVKIIIPKEIKKDILMELSCRGIDEAYIYPTLENYCKVIKEQTKKVSESHAAYSEAFLRLFTEEK